VEISDEALCERVARRDDEALGTLVARYQERAYRLAWSILRDADEARDLSQDAFVRLWEAAGSFRGQAKFSTWFYRILDNLGRHHRPRHRGWRRLVGGSGPDNDSSEVLVERLPSLEPEPGSELGKDEMMHRVWAAVGRLSPQQRAAVILHVQEELPTREIAAVLRCSEATVRVHLHRAIAALRQSIGRG
jgi:RNA polymerase sigma-70 factor (ECF subfamily)